MSGKVVGWAFETGRIQNLSPTERYVLVAYADNASEKEGKCWPDKPEIIEKTGLSRATVYRAIRTLEAGGLLAETTDEKGRECIFLRVPWSSHCETDESQGETTPPEAPSQPETPESHGENSPSHSETGSNKEPSSNRQEPSCEPPKGGTQTGGDPDFGVLPAAVGAPLRQVAKAKGGNFNAESIKRACDAYPDRDHALEAEKFCAWHLDGGGQNAPLRVVAVGFKGWLRNAPPVEKVPGAAPRRPTEPVPALGEIGKRAEEAAAAWAAATVELRQVVRESTYRLWLKRLVPVGRDDGAIYFAAPEDIRAWVERRYTTLIGEALAPHLGTVRVRVIPETEPTAEAA